MRINGQGGQDGARQVFFRQTDILVIAALLAAAVLVYVLLSHGDAGTVCEVRQDNRVIAVLPLDEDGEHVLPECPNVTFSVRDGRISFVRSDCPDKLCVRMGYISHAYENAICLPNRLMLRVRSPRTEALDAVAG